MDFGIWLYRSKYLSKGEFVKCLLSQRGLETFKSDEHEHFATLGFADAMPPDSLNQLRVIPFGHVLEIRKYVSRVLERAQCETLEQVIQRWQLWHVENLEPISDYSLDGDFGKQLYRNQYEKKAVAAYIALKPMDDQLPLIRDTDAIIIPEGSSGLYVGLAAALHHKRMNFVTTNGSIVREYLENPELQSKKRIEKIRIVGGEPDPNHRSTTGEWSRDQLIDEIQSGDPTTTVLICSCVGISLEKGPCAPEAKAAADRFALIDGALTKNIRAVIFISDYMKHRNDPKIYEHPIFETTWKAIRNKYSDIFWIVTSPPPAHREHILKTGDQAMLGTRASLLMSKDGALKRHVAGEYEANVQRLAEAMRVHEACEILEPAIV